MNLKKYPLRKFEREPNKKKMPLIELKFNDEGVKEFNEIYQYCRRNLTYVNTTESGSLPYNDRVRYCSRYMVIKGNQDIDSENENKASYELTIESFEGCCRFVIHNFKDDEGDRHTGTQAVKYIYKLARKMGIDLSEFENKDDWKKVKESISSPHIQVLNPLFVGVKLTNVIHIDINSCYAAKISQEYPKLAPIFNAIYEERIVAKQIHDENKQKFLKDVLNMCIGMFQSRHCPKWKGKGKQTEPYQFVNLSKCAVDGCRKEIEGLIEWAFDNGWVPVLTNTDGIFLMSFDDKKFNHPNLGTGLGQYKIDFRGDLIIKSPGCYQIRHKSGLIESKCRGRSKLDEIKPRDQWYFGEILVGDNGLVKRYSWDDEKGIIERYE